MKTILGTSGGKRFVEKESATGKASRANGGTDAATEVNAVQNQNGNESARVPISHRTRVALKEMGHEVRYGPASKFRCVLWSASLLNQGYVTEPVSPLSKEICSSDSEYNIISLKGN